MKVQFYKNLGKRKIQNILLSIAILIISYFTYFHNYNYPQAVFWDENYHIPAAQKYLNQTFFMYEHPPLGPMLIALGEKLLHSNNFSNQFNDVYYAKDFPPNFSFTGYRFIPTVCAWLLPLIFFFIALNLVGNRIIAFLLSFLVLFDNAMIVHFRAAMLEAPLMLFIALSILFFLLALKNKKYNKRLVISSIGLGVSVGLVATTKITGLIVLLLIPLLFSKLFPQWQKVALSLGIVLISFVVTFVTVWQIHFSIAKNINPNLDNSGYFNISAEYREFIDQNKQNEIWSFPLRLQEHFKHVKNYQKGVPKLDLSKPDENGSPSLFWPLGARAINYRWETADGVIYKYLYLQANPVVWILGLSGVLGTTALFFIYIFFSLREAITKRFLMATFWLLYWSYMVIISQLGRVMYLYHYFPALLFSFCLFSLLIEEARQIGNMLLTTRYKILILAVLSAAIFVSYRFYSPLTYYQPLNDEQFRQRMIFPLWDLRCVNCERTRLFRK
ncbi:phospholipid carrier-dependent glycosyltransferase [Synechocystis salina LEGE 06155]|nr:phospholipid carrier-dependent glycosyltransferase [Synechocystis salina LEGE 06155]